ncbi:MAG: ABC transporter permease [Acidobacteria bacterium]|nr:MAG: ABC transporter permease [Acidobacteriota bacterium]
MLNEFRVALRSLLKTPAFTLTAVAALALGIGANTAVFGLVNQLLLNPPGMSEPERVVAIRAKYDKLALKSIGVSTPDFADVRDARETFEAAAAVSTGDLNYTGGSTPERLLGAAVSVRWFDVFGVKPALGRAFTPEEDQENAGPVAILSHAAWQRLFGGDPSVVGRTIPLNQKPHKVVGVMGAEFRWPRQTDIWVPLGLPAKEYTVDYRFNEHLWAYARTRPGISAAQADAVVRLLAERLRNDGTGNGAFARDAGWGMFAVPAREFTAGDTRTPVLVLMGAVGFVLLIACSNIAGLMVARAAARGRDTAVRAALGAARWQLLRHSLAESLLLAGAGAVAGLALAWVGMRTLLLLAPERTTAGLSAGLDLPMLAFTVLVAVGASLLFGLAPAWHASGRAPVDALKAGGRSSGGSTRQTLRSLLVVSETALALVLLVGAGLFLRSLANMQEIHPGFDAQGVMTAGLSLPDAVYKEPAQRANFYRTVLERLASAPGATVVAAAVPLPFTGNNPSASFNIEGRQPGPGDPGPHADVRYVTPGYFGALKVPLKAGRLFTAQDREGALRVVVVDENLVRQYWPGESPLGKRLRRGTSAAAAWWTVVGVVGHVKHASLAADVGKGAIYYPLFQQPMSSAWIVARSAGDTAPLASAIRAAVREADPAQPLQRLSSLDELVASSLDAPRFVMRLLAFFAAVALFMAALGLFGVISYSVTQRTQELGVRMALGAPRTSVLRMVVGQGFRLAASGVAVGVLAALAASRLLASQLYQVTVFDPPTFAATVGILLGAALLASYFPARRATRVDPLLALRQE